MFIKIAAMTAALSLLAGCAADDPHGAFLSRPTVDVPVSRSSADQHLRPVAMPAGDGIAYVRGETAAQALCHALTPDEWKAALGGPVFRSFEVTGTGATCVAERGALRVQLGMKKHELATVGTTDEEVAGHPARFAPSERHASAAVAVVPLGLKSIKEQVNSAADPVLYATAEVRWPDEYWGSVMSRLRRLLAVVVPRLTAPGPATPFVAGMEDLPFTPTAPPPGVPLADLPHQIQALVLCTAAARVLGKPDSEVRPGVTGYCRIGDVTLFVNEFGGRGSEETPVAGRPAEIDYRGVEVELLRLPAEFSDRYIVLEIHAAQADLKAFAERICAEVLVA